jgi:hypothetical protein
MKSAARISLSNIASSQIVHMGASGSGFDVNPTRIQPIKRGGLNPRGLGASAASKEGGKKIPTSETNHVATLQAHRGHHYHGGK